MWTGEGVRPSPLHSRRATGEKAAPHLPMDILRNVVRPMSLLGFPPGNPIVRGGDGTAGTGEWRKRMSVYARHGPVMGRIEVQTVPHVKAG